MVDASVLALVLLDDGSAGQRLVDRVWQWQENLTAYDAAYVALAEALGVALVTVDVRLINAPGVTCQTIIP